MFGKKKKKKQEEKTPEQFRAQWEQDWGKPFPDYEHVNDPKVAWMDRPLTLDEAVGQGMPSPTGTVMSEETKQRIQKEAGVGVEWYPSGSRLPFGQIPEIARRSVGLATGTVPYNHSYVATDSIDVDALWEKMYVKMRKVIVICSYCGRPTVISEGNCPKCGAPLPVEFL